MSWFSQKDWSAIAQSAKTALTTAQKTIDRALDIEEETKQVHAPGDQELPHTPTVSQPAITNLDTDSFFDSFLSPVSVKHEIQISGRSSPSALSEHANRRRSVSSQPVSSGTFSTGRKRSSASMFPGNTDRDIQDTTATQSVDQPQTSSHSTSKHHRSKSSGNVSPVHSQKSNGQSSCSESIEVLSLISSEKLGESYYQDFASPPKLNVLHKALKNGDGSSSSSANNQHSPNSSDYGVEEPASPPDEYQDDLEITQPELVATLSTVPLNTPSEPVNDDTLSPVNSGTSSEATQSWTMVSDSQYNAPEVSASVVTSNFTFQPDLLSATDDSVPRLHPVASSDSQSTVMSAVSDNSNSSTVELRAVTPPDIQQMTSAFDSNVHNESLQTLPDVQLNTSSYSEDQLEFQTPDLTSSSRERPDIFPAEEPALDSHSVQNVDVVVQALDVISTVDDENSTRMSNDEGEMSHDAPPNLIDVVVQELDVVQGNEQSSNNAVTTLDILPTHAERLNGGSDLGNETSVVDMRLQEMSILNDLSAASMDRNGSMLASQHSESNSAIVDELLQKIQSLEETVQAREQQLFSVNKRATDALEENEELKSQLELQERKFEEESSKAAESHQLELNTITIKYNSTQQKVKDLEKQINDLRSSSSLSAQLQSSLREKDAIIEEMRVEGEKLAQEEYKKNSLIKKLKAKEKELQTSLDKTKQSLEDKTGELESYTDSFTKLQQKVSEQRDTINQMNSTMTRNEQMLSKKTNENEELIEKTHALENNLDSVFRELREVQQQLADKEAKFAQSQAVVNEEILQEKEEVLRSAQVKWDQEKEMLVQQLQDASVSGARVEQAANRRETMLKDEIKHLQMRLEEEMQRGQGLSEGVSQATQPLWNQISRLQRQQQDQQTQWTQLEKSYLDRLAEAESRAGQAAESERLANETCVELKCRVSSLEAQLATIRSEHSKAVKLSEQKDVDIERLKEQISKLKGELVSGNEKCALVERQLSLVQADLTAEKQTSEQLKRKCRTAEEQSRELSLRLKEVDGGFGSKSSPVPSTSASNANVAPNDGSKIDVASSRNLSSWEYLESRVKLKDGEASALQGELRKLEQHNIQLREDYIKLSNERHEWLSDKEALSQLKTDLAELSERYETLLTMYGEKAEQVDELQMDLSDVKVIYKAQIEDLVKKLVQQKS